MDQFTVENDGVRLNVIAKGAGPAVLCVHGWPELSHSWRHQLDYFGTRGWRIAAMDVRGYGGSDKPEPVEAYRMKTINADVAAVIDAMGGEVVLIGHDWGAPIVYTTALRYPHKVRAVAGLSVPFQPQADVSFLGLMRQIYKDRFFYQLYFQKEGVAEAELEGDPDAHAKIMLALSSVGSGFAEAAAAEDPNRTTLLAGLKVPDPLPAWVTPEDLATYKNAFAEGGWRGPINRYRAQDMDFEERADVLGKHIEQPACFIAGERDLVRRFRPGADLYDYAAVGCRDFRGKTIIPGAGHWVQQEKPGETNAALEMFLTGL